MKRTLEEKFNLLKNDPNWTTVNLPVEPGQQAMEEVLVERISQDSFRIAASPGMIEGIAEDDCIRLDASLPVGYELLKRGRNVCIHLFTSPDIRRQILARLLPAVEAIGGWLDGTMADVGLCFTIPVSSGFSTIESIFCSVVGNDWYYSNVYDPITYQPLNWWKE